MAKRADEATPHGSQGRVGMPKVIYEKDGRIGRITLNRPEVMNAIDDDLPVELADCVAKANADGGVHVIVLAGAGSFVPRSGVRAAAKLHIFAWTRRGPPRII